MNILTFYLKSGNVVRVRSQESVDFWLTRRHDEEKVGPGIAFIGSYRRHPDSFTVNWAAVEMMTVEPEVENA